MYWYVYNMSAMTSFIECNIVDIPYKRCILTQFYMVYKKFSYGFRATNEMFDKKHTGDACLWLG